MGAARGGGAPLVRFARGCPHIGGCLTRPLGSSHIHAVDPEILKSSFAVVERRAEFAVKSGSFGIEGLAGVTRSG